MKLTRYCGLAALSLAVLASACSKSDDNNNSKSPQELILGTWQLTDGKLLEIEGTDTARATDTGVVGDFVIFDNQNKAVFYDEGKATSPQSYTLHSATDLEIAGLHLAVLKLNASELVFERHSTDPMFPGSFYQYTWSYHR